MLGKKGETWNITSSYPLASRFQQLILCLIPDCVHLLLAHGAPVKVKNLAGWSPLSEAISYGDRRTSNESFLIIFHVVGIIMQSESRNNVS